MKPRTKRNLATVIGIGIGLAGVTLLVFPLLWKLPDGRPKIADSIDTKQGEIQPVDLGSLKPLLKLRLQRPLVDPVKKTKKPIKEPKRPATKPWPKFELSCVFIGNNSQLAVFKLNQKSHSCVEGDTFGEVKVVEIGSDSVTVEFSGESRVVELPEDDQGVVQ